MRSRLVPATLSIFLAGTPLALAQRSLGQNQASPVSKLYLAEAVGEGTVISGGVEVPTRKATAFDAPGSVIETAKDAHQAYVYSNGTGMFVDENTRVMVTRFAQEIFTPNRDGQADIEPSISTSDVFVSRGLVGFCTSKLVSGSTMTYATHDSTVNVRTGKLCIQADPAGTRVYLLEGDCTVRLPSRDGGTWLLPGEVATIPKGATSPASITVARMDPAEASALDDKVAVACNAKKTVSFDVTTASGDATATVTASPLITKSPPTNIVVSPDRLQ